MGVTSAATGRIRHEDRVLACVSGNIHMSSNDPVQDMVAESWVAESWKRCAQSYRLDPARRSETRILTQAELHDFREPVEPLVRIAKAEIQRLHRQVNAADHVVLLTDRNGVAIDYVGEQAFEADLKQAGLYLGSVWSEEHEGTNGVGTCIIVERPLTVFRDDHFKSRHIGLTCTVCPIFDPAGALIAVLDISALASQARESQAFAQHLVSATAQRIEHALFLEHFREAWIVRLLDQNGLADPDGINLLAIDADRRIVGIDGRSRRRGANAFIGRSLAEVFETGADPHMLRPNEGTAAFSVRSIMSGEDYLAIAQPPRCLRPTRPRPRPEAPSALTLDTLAQGDPRMAAAVRVAERVMNRNISIILHGETGSGKEVFAKAVHLASDRASRAFVAVNCASIPETLIESELFGYTAGAFTGANRQGAKGKIAESDGGTLFLDEIGDMPMALQTRLLRVLAESEVSPLGGGKPVPVRLSVICATHRNLRELVDAGRFREDLFYRLNGAPMILPPLRDRTDIDTVIRMVWTMVEQETGGWRSLDDTIVAALRRHPWPGNIRELRNVLMLMSAMAEGDRVTLADLPGDLASPVISPRKTLPTRQRLTRDLLITTLKRHKWCVTRTAEELDVSRSTVHRKMAAWQISSPNHQREVH
jgi:sigma-54 dependent transcriptional regulator, acetoin dehydrogenase operon transcriptional activator AcoR